MAATSARVFWEGSVGTQVVFNANVMKSYFEPMGSERPIHTSKRLNQDQHYSD